MKLSEAMRLGAMLHPQGFCGLMRNGRTCAMGAAYMAEGRLVGNAPDSSLWASFLAQRAPACPECARYSGDIVYALITHLNDGHYWTRERIADFVESIEPQQEKGEAAPLQAVTA